MTSLRSADLLLISTTQTGQAHFFVYFSLLVLVHMHVGTGTEPYRLSRE